MLQVLVIFLKRAVYLKEQTFLNEQGAAFNVLQSPSKENE
jgi:hypothetical protein